MLFPIIRIKDGEMEDRIVGTNVHDHLYIKGNAIHYLNTQCMAGTESEEDCISFVTRDDTPLDHTFAYAPQVEWATLDEIIDMEMERIGKVSKNKIAQYRMIKEEWVGKVDKAERETGVRMSRGAI